MASITTSSSPKGDPLISIQACTHRSPRRSIHGFSMQICDVGKKQIAERSTQNCTLGSTKMLLLRNLQCTAACSRVYDAIPVCDHSGHTAACNRVHVATETDTTTACTMLQHSRARCAEVADGPGLHHGSVDGRGESAIHEARYAKGLDGSCAGQMLSHVCPRRCTLTCK